MNWYTVANFSFYIVPETKFYFLFCGKILSTSNFVCEEKVMWNVAILIAIAKIIPLSLHHKQSHHDPSGRVPRKSDQVGGHEMLTQILSSQWLSTPGFFKLVFIKLKTNLMGSVRE